jgi:hypothetical protein
MAQSSVELSGRPATAVRPAVRLRGFSKERTSRYSRGYLPQALRAVCGLLTELTKKHREYPGVAIATRGIDLKALVRNGAGDLEPGKADDYIRALENMAILIEVEINGGEAVMLFDRERMEQLAAFNEGAGDFSELDENLVLTRARELIEYARTRKSPLPEPIPERGSDPALPEYEDALLAFEGAKQTISDGEVTLKDVVKNPLGVLKRSFPKARADRLETHVFCAKRDRNLTPLPTDDDLFYLTREPLTDRFLRKMVPGVENELQRVLERSMSNIDLHIRKLSKKLDGERANQQVRRRDCLQEIEIRYRTMIEEGRKEILHQLEESIGQLRAESEKDLASRMEQLRQEFAQKELEIRKQITTRLEEEIQVCTQQAKELTEGKNAEIEMQRKSALQDEEANLERREQVEIHSLQGTIEQLESDRAALVASLSVAKR